MSSSAIAAKEISKSYSGKPALDKVTIDIVECETFGLLGPNGAGKSTLINILSGVTQADSGSMEFLGETYTEPTYNFKMNLGVIPQEISLYEKLSARENLEFYGSLYGLDRKTLNARCDEALELVGLSDRQNDRVGTYSGGMKRRINLASSILHRPKFIFMDEPTVGIDPQSRNLIFEVIERLHNNGTTILYTSHYMEEVERLCNNIAILDHGKVIACGTKQELIALIGGVDNIEVEFELSDEPGIDKFEKLFPDMQPVFSDGVLLLKTVDGSSQLGGIVTTLTSKDFPIKRIHVREPNLETVFLHLTGKGLRD